MGDDEDEEACDGEATAFTALIKGQLQTMAKTSSLTAFDVCNVVLVVAAGTFTDDADADDDDDGYGNTLAKDDDPSVLLLASIAIVVQIVVNALWPEW